MTYLDHKDGKLTLTPEEREVNRLQELQNCTTCDNAQRVNGFGARVCFLDRDCAPVLAGEIICVDYV